MTTKGMPGATFGQELKNAGRMVGRRYDTDRAKRLTASIHTRYDRNCRVCEALRQSNTPIVPHYEQSIYD